MGEVIELGRASGRARGGGGGRRGRRSKTALVLGGGGFTGGVYEIGALRALDLLAVDRTVNDFDVYVGTSAGAVVAALAANGVTPAEMMRVVDGGGPATFADVEVGTVLRPNYRELVRKGALLPLRAAGLLRELLPQLGRGVSVMDLVLGLGEAMPSGLYSGAGLEEYLRDVLSAPGRTDDFRALERRLLVCATDLDTCERIVLGDEGWDDVPISTAVRASSALPMVFAPAEVRGRELVDGGIVSTTNLDLAVEAGARFVVVVNPLVPYVGGGGGGAASGSRPRRVSDMGLPQIGLQTFKLMAYQRLHELARQWEERYPGVDIVLIEPEPDDELMFQTSVMNFTSRVAIARHGFESVTVKLAADLDAHRAVCERHGIAISADRVREAVEQVAAEPEPTRAWRRILGPPSVARLRPSAGDA
jgi:predicted acylesterase/phospholipase RssA